MIGTCAVADEWVLGAAPGQFDPSKQSDAAYVEAENGDQLGFMCEDGKHLFAYFVTSQIWTQYPTIVVELPLAQYPAGMDGTFYPEQTTVLDGKTRGFAQEHDAIRMMNEIVLIDPIKFDANFWAVSGRQLRSMNFRKLNSAKSVLEPILRECGIIR